MPEQDKKERVLAGETSVSQSSDEYIASNLKQIQGEVYAVDNSLVDIDVYTPQHIDSATHSTNVEIITPAGLLTSVGETRKTDSAFAMRILLDRIRKLRPT